MNDELRARMIQQTRREIMRALCLVYPVPFSFPSLRDSLVELNLPDADVIKRDLVYLMDKGYVEWTNRRDYMGWDQRLYKLTASGNEVANRILHDPALGL